MTGSPLSVVVAPDKFKGSLSAAEVADTVTDVLKGYLPDAAIMAMPIADGGEGTVALALDAGFEPVTVIVTGPLAEPVDAMYARRGHEAVIEMAAAAGMVLLPGEPTPEMASTATSAGVGELLLHAIDHGATAITLGLGGSACTDGGAGMAQRLGAEVTTTGGEPVGLGGAALGAVASVDLESMRARLAGVEITIACDVDNPLLGPEGSAAIYGPQKGADASTVALLDQSLSVWNTALHAATGTDVSATPGVGAAGGLSTPLIVAGVATIRPGAETVLGFTGLGGNIDSADLVVVGEGSLDEQSLRGKAPVAVARRASAAGAHVVAVVGQCVLTDPQIHDAGIDQVLAVADREPDLDTAIANAKSIVHDMVDEVGPQLVQHFQTL